MSAAAVQPAVRPGPWRTPRAADAQPMFTVRVSDETEYADGGGLDGGYAVRVSDATWSVDAGGGGIVTAHGDAGVAVSGDAGLESAEVSWLLAHIGDGADAANPSDGPNVRALAQRGADGVRATASLFRAGDVARTPFARRILERVAIRACRARPRNAAGDLLHWVEMGTTTRVVPDGGLTFTWERGIAVLWPRDAMERLERWADEGAVCRVPAPRERDAGASDATSTGVDAAVTGVDAARDASSGVAPDA